jgi:growth arrest-specific protein 8
MPPKKDAGGAKKKKDEAPPPVPSEFDAMDTASLKKILLELRTDTEKVSRERAQAQVDRDAVERFFEVTKKELRENELSILAKEREMDLMAENHRVEYEHAHGMKKLGVEEEIMLKADEDSHLRREANMRAEKMSLKSRVREVEEANAEAVRTMKSLQDKNISKLRQEFAANLEQLRAKYELRVKHLREDLRLRHKVEVHEVEERKNLHINQLMKAHDEAFSEMKRYYNDITKANLQLISQLRAQIAEANEKVSANQRLMREIAEQNTRLKDPLERATKDLAELHEELKDAEKDKQSLRYAKGRLAVSIAIGSFQELDSWRSWP